MPTLLPDLSTRVRVPEIMDDPSLDRARHIQALHALERVNTASRGAARLRRAILRLHAARPDRPVRVLDLACGGGDLLRRVARWARRAGVEVDLLGCDRSGAALEYARARAAAERVQVRFLTRDVLGEPLPAGYDLVSSSLFLHHLSEDEAVSLLGRMGSAASRGVLVQDLRRTRAGLLLAWLGLRALTRSGVAHHDGPASVRSALTIGEAAALAEAAGLRGATVRPCWPQRFLLEWWRS